MDEAGLTVQAHQPNAEQERTAVVALGLLCASAIALAVAPLAITNSYSWVEHTTSESAAQRVDGAWVARAGFVMFGLAVLWIAERQRDRWRPFATALHTGFAVCMIAVAAFSSRSWEATTVYDSTEDLLHSVGATVMGFAFALGVVAVAVITTNTKGGVRPLDLIAVSASVVLPLWMAADGSSAGLLQRIMFAIAYVWYGREALS